MSIGSSASPLLFVIQGTSDYIRGAIYIQQCNSWKYNYIRVTYLGTLNTSLRNHIRAVFGQKIITSECLRVEGISNARRGLEEGRWKAGSQ